MLSNIVGLVFIVILYRILRIPNLEESKQELEKLSRQTDFTNYMFENIKDDNKNAEGKEKEEQIRKSISLCDRYLEKKPNNPHALFWKAGSFLELNEFEQAIKIYKELVTIEPKYLNYTQGLANAYAKSGKLKTGLNIIEDFYDINKIEKNDEYYTAIGSVYEMAGQYDIALKSYNAAIEYDENSYYSYYARAYLYKKMNRMEEYEKDYRKCRRLISEPNETQKTPLQTVKINTFSDIKNLFKNSKNNAWCYIIGIIIGILLLICLLIIFGAILITNNRYT